MVITSGASQGRSMSSGVNPAAVLSRSTPRFYFKNMMLNHFCAVISWDRTHRGTPGWPISEVAIMLKSALLCHKGDKPVNVGPTHKHTLVVYYLYEGLRHNTVNAPVG